SMATISRTAEVPASNACQKLTVLLPRALTTPVPVTTTRCMLFNRQRGALRLDEKSDAVDHLANVLDLLCLFVIDLDLELALEIKKNVEAIERVDIEFLEAAFWLHSF